MLDADVQDSSIFDKSQSRNRSNVGRSMLLSRLHEMETMALSLTRMITEIRMEIDGLDRESSHSSKIHDCRVECGAQTGNSKDPKGIIEQDEGDDNRAKHKTNLASPILIETHAMDSTVSPRTTHFELIDIPYADQKRCPKPLIQTHTGNGNPLTQHLQSILIDDDIRKITDDEPILLQSEIQQKLIDNDCAWETMTDQDDKPNASKRMSAAAVPTPRRQKLSKVASLSLQRSGSYLQWLGKHQSVAASTTPSTVAPTASAPSSDSPASAVPRTAEPQTVLGKQIVGVVGCGDKRVERASNVALRTVNEPQPAPFHRRQTSELHRHSLLYQPQSILSNHKRARPATSYATSDGRSKRENRLGNDHRGISSTDEVKASLIWDSPNVHDQPHSSSPSGGALWRMLTTRIATSVRSPRN